MDDLESFNIEKVDENCQCGELKETDEEQCQTCLKNSKRDLKCKICYYFLDPALCFVCNKTSNQKKNNTRSVTSVRDDVIIPEHLVYGFQQRRLRHQKNQQPEDNSLDDQCEPE
jgi:hypothetical protein